ncbi:ubiquitin carboxyl-terminal hydrolase 9-like isoform X1 [Salvia splendens]|uniref:ubiquitin carboxyl-terminal hydrolase 9-like isoform X1 n=1 Tax=Salvia splendens TaxID=180675 RepID=UPI001C262784|nr:ubiquitin carboxyl-terminal hydrolase 9-like isoform X1 [Salvia splendens]
MMIPDSCVHDSSMENGSIETPCTPEEERRIIEELTDKAEANLREGNLYYVVSSRWFMAWQRYIGKIEDDYPFDSSSVGPSSVASSCTKDRPGPIDNTDLVINEVKDKDEDLQLHRTLQEGHDYELVPEEVWERLLKWYKGGPVLKRKMISVGEQRKQFSVEVFPVHLRLIDSRDQSEAVIRLSKKASLRSLYEKVCQLKGLDPEKICIWDYFNKKQGTILVSCSQTLEESNVLMDQEILLKVPVDGVTRDSTGKSLAMVPVESTGSTSSIAGGPSMSNGHSTSYNSNTHEQITSTYGDMEDGHDGLKPEAGGDRGLAGLQNLGNTCFMNSALQCLVHTPYLVDYFVQDYSSEINKQNPLGMRGELALAFGELLRRLWSSGRTPVAPRVFKGKLARFAPQFSGYNQHDSQELLAFLLDGLHEDLNRVKQKPYIEAKDYDGQPDEEVADEFWKYHKARNDSVIVDICQGQYKSTLVCPVCDKISITFDPFMYLSLPLPSIATRSMTVTVIYGDGSSLPMPFTVNVLKEGNCKDLIQALGIACGVHSDEYLLLAEVFENRIYRYLESPSEPLAGIKDDEHIVAYRLPKRDADLTRLEIHHRYQDNDRKLFLTPFVTDLEDPQSGADIYLAVERLLSPLRRKEFYTSTSMDYSRENGSFSGNTCTDQLGPEIQSTGEIEGEGMPSKDFTFQLCITEDNCLAKLSSHFSWRPIMKNTPIRPSRLAKFLVEWTEKEHEIYSASYLQVLPEVHKSQIFANKSKQQEAVSLFSCLDAFLKEEPLGPDDMWYCPQCKEHRQASKKLDLWRLPDILVIHLKRFSYSKWMKNKLDTTVDFPIHNLDVSKYVKSNDGRHVYKLYAISNHYGGLGGGHYSAYCKLIDGENKWYHFDDSHVSPVSESEIKTSAAYLLFYERVKHNSNGTSDEPSEHLSPS